MTRQTPGPLVRANLSATYRRAEELSRTFVQEFGLDLAPSYQRGDVWTADQRIALVRSWLTGIPTGVVILSDRTTPQWEKANGSNPKETGQPMYAVIDGKQRITTAQMWFASEFAVPPRGSIPNTSKQPKRATTDCMCGTAGSRRPAGRTCALVQVAEAQPAGVEEEAAIYLLVNGGGTPQTSHDMQQAARLANL